MINIGDYVTRKSHGNDIIFEVINIKDHDVELKGVNVRLIADAPIKDLNTINKNEVKDDFNPTCESIQNRNEYFYLPGKVLHIDGDKSYLNRCIEYYQKNNIKVVGKSIKEEKMYTEIGKLLIENKPDILVITGHDAYYKDNTYKNSINFCKAVKEARKYEKSNDKLIIIAGACQSDYSSLLKSGATYASSPKKINIHALDPAIIATNIALVDKNKEIDLISLLNKTKFGSDGMGGLKTKGMMYTGYPRVVEK